MLLLDRTEYMFETNLQLQHHSLKPLASEVVYWRI